MLKDKLKKDIMQAMKNRDTKQVEVLRFLVSLIDKKELQMPVGQMQEKDEVTVLQKELKNKQEAEAIFAKAGRTDLASGVAEEIKILKTYLPEALTEEEIVKLVDEAIEKVGVNFGMVMKEVISTAGGRAGGEMVSRIVKERIEKSNK